MEGSRIFGFLAPALFALISAPAFGQGVTSSDPVEAARQKEVQRQEEQEKAIRDRSIAEMDRFLRDSFRTSRPPTSAAAEIQAGFFEFRQAIPRFRVATDEYRWAVSIESKLEKHLKNIAAQADVMLRYLKLSKMKVPPTNAAEFKDYTQAEFMWETLNSAERIAAYLDLAVAVERQEVLAPPMIEFMYRLNGELLRLKWLTEHTKG